LNERRPIYYINLASRPDRRAYFEAELKRVGLSATRIEAVTPADLSAADLSRYCDPQSRQHLQPVELACARSHVRSWQTHLDSADSPDWCLVLEDDGILSNSLPTFIEQFLASDASASVDLVQLEVRPRAVRVLPPKWTLPSGTRLREFRGTRDGGGCYLISKRAISVLLARPDLFDQAIDLALFRPFISPGSAVRSALADPGLCVQLDQIGDQRGGSRSDLAEARTGSFIRNKHSLRSMLWAISPTSLANLRDHVVHLPAGLTRRTIPFDGDLTGR
jgi:glycosyl transferase family 25